MQEEEATKITADHLTFLAEQYKLVDSTVPKVLTFMPCSFSMMVIANISKNILLNFILCEISYLMSVLKYSNITLYVTVMTTDLNLVSCDILSLDF